MLAVRDPTKGNEAAAKIKGSVEVFACDLGDLASVKAFAKRWGDRPVDVLMLNAGVMAIPERSLTKDGFERHYAVNHLGHFALTALLWPSVRKAAEKGEGGGARVVVVSSDGHKKGSIGAPPSRRGTATRTHARTHARTGGGTALSAYRLRSHSLRRHQPREEGRVQGLRHALLLRLHAVEARQCALRQGTRAPRARRPRRESPPPPPPPAAAK